MSDGYIKNGQYTKTSGISRPIPHGTLAQINQMIASGVLKEGDQVYCDDDGYVAIGATDISAIGDGTVTGAISKHNNDITEIKESLSIVLELDVNTTSQVTQLPSGIDSDTYAISGESIKTVYGSWVNQEYDQAIYGVLVLFKNNTVTLEARSNKAEKIRLTFTKIKS